MSKLRSWRFATVAVSCLTLAATAGCVLQNKSLAGSGSGAQARKSTFCPAANMNELVSKAKKEGRVDWYESPSSVDQAAKNAFKKKYGITVVSLRLPSTDLDTRFESEQAAGVHVADVYLSSYEGQQHLEDWVKRGLLFSSLDKAGIPDFPGSFPKTDLLGAAATVQVGGFGIAYNKKTVSSPPKSFQELVDPKWRGKIMVASPASSQVYTDFWTAIKKRFGLKFLEQLKTQDLKMADSANPAVQNVAAGGAQLAIPINGGVLGSLISKGAPIALSTPSGTFGPQFVVSLVEHAPHPYAACLFTQWLMSPEGNKVIADSANEPSVYDQSGPQVTPLPNATSSERDAILKFWGVSK